MGFADCKETAIAVSGQIIGSEIYYGLYVPTTPKETWDEGWKRTGDPVFTHFWVVKDNEIIDHAAEQFGESPEVRTSKDDLRYVTVGKYDPTKDACNPVVSDPQIHWPPALKPGGVVKVTWEGYFTRLNQLGK